MTDEERPAFFLRHDSFWLDGWRRSAPQPRAAVTRPRSCKTCPAATTNSTPKRSALRIATALTELALAL